MGVFRVFQIVQKWYQIAQNITYIINNKNSNDNININNTKILIILIVY